MVETAQRVSIPIEITPEDSREIKELLERIERADSKLNKIQTSGLSEDSYGLAAGVSPVYINPMSDDVDDNLPKGFHFKDQSSRAPFERQHPFSQLSDRVENLESNTGIQNIKYGLGAEALGVAKGGMGGTIMATIQKFIPDIAAIFIAKGFVDLIIHEAFGEGKPFDRRWRREIRKENTKLTNLETKARLRQGMAEMRVSSYAGVRGGKGIVFTNLQLNKNRKTLYDVRLEMMEKGP